MHINHIAIWTSDIDRLKRFYKTYFGASAGPGYVNAAKGFESCFLSFRKEARIELMRTTRFSPLQIEPGAQHMGLTHFSISIGSEEKVNELTEQLKKDGFSVIDGPRRTGDGCYESVVLDPDGNRLELTE
jgi:lactoylglutathione lyase